jgi:hypothetical protein
MLIILARAGRAWLLAADVDGWAMPFNCRIADSCMGYERKQGSLLLSILIHTSISSSALILGQQYAYINEELIWTAVSVGIEFLGAVLMWLGVHRPSSHCS